MERLSGFPYAQKPHPTLLASKIHRFFIADEFVKGT
jgi:hypothetical protein